MKLICSIHTMILLHQLGQTTISHRKHHYEVLVDFYQYNEFDLILKYVVTILHEHIILFHQSAKTNSNNIFITK